MPAPVDWAVHLPPRWLESLVLAQYCAGIDVTTERYRGALVTTWDMLLNRYTWVSLTRR